MVIVDASVAYKWFNPEEPLSSKAINIFSNHLKGLEEIIMPSLLFYELANAWATKTALEPSQIENNINDLEKANFIEIPTTFLLIKKMVQFSKKYRVSVYDACYAVLAEEKKCDLITADEKFAEKVNLPFIKKLADYVI